MTPYVTLILVIETICTISMIGFTYNSFIRHKKKDTEITHILLVAFSMFTCALIFQTIGTHLTYIAEIHTLPVTLQNQGIIIPWILFIIQRNQISQYFVMIGIYALFQFSQKIFDEKNIKILNHIILFYLGFVFCIFIFLIPVFGIWNYEYHDISYYLTAEILVLIFPLFLKCRKICTTVDRTNPLYSNICNMMHMSMGIIVAFLIFAIEATIFRTNLTILTLIGWVQILIVTANIYLAFFKNNISKHK